MDDEGNLVDPTKPSEISREHARQIYVTMVRLQVMDNLFYEAQRQGRFSFYLQSTGEEALNVGSAAGMDAKDTVLAQYREQGVIMWRGFTYKQFAHQVLGTHQALGKGRQMPIHYGSAELYFHTISSPLATQIPQAVGVAYANKMDNRPQVAVVYFGDGAASEGDFHAAMNFASTLEVPVVFICRNNGWAISTPAHEQYRGDGIAGRGPAYGIPTTRVDGNDALAMWEVSAAARKIALEESRPVLIEAMTYRSAHHSTSDDSARYRSKDEMKRWQGREPVGRFRLWLESKGWWTEEEEVDLRNSSRVELLAAIEDAEKAPKPSLENMVTDVYDVVPPQLREQEAGVARMIELHSQDFESLNLAKK
ncbi:hypothetical protein CYMTET_48207 [Cymbomonas tetramitiformis]|uniref:3-methyl-2-oxobutanoate dehydrogenase (2-methylpropanoyl-transferring) n=1 Tax=Cymbomonas tetramitiformis TaxID=36881 RepID=A0AAE0EVU9_9CHLO|nr:hypothetical protein CYMTET_48207 [Cymbomonas tetramitiformis]